MQCLEKESTGAAIQQSIHDTHPHPCVTINNLTVLLQAVGCLMSVVIDLSFNPGGRRDWKALGFSQDTANKAELSSKLFVVCFNKANIAERYG